MSGAIIGKYAGQDKHDSTEQRQTTAQQNNQDRNKCIQEGREGVFGVAGHGRAEEHAMISDASTVEHREEGRGGREHGVGACLVRGLP